MKPYGAPFITNQQAISEDGSVYFSWAVNGNGRDVTSVEVLRGGSLVSNNHSEHREAGLAASTSVSIEVRVTTNAEDSTRSTASATLTGTSNALSIDISPGGAAGSGLTFLNLNTRNYPAGTYNIACKADEWSTADKVYKRETVAIPANGSVAVCPVVYRTGWVEISIDGAPSPGRHGIA